MTHPGSPHPTRGQRSAYDRYLSGMDASMRQKVALTAAHLLSRGRIADMGMGSGSGSHALAALYPELEVIGVDVDPTMVQLAQEKFSLDNLSFVVGDVSERIFEAGSLDAIFDSSVLHHVTSFSGYDRDAAERALITQASMLREGGVLIVRDFVDPGPGDVWLDLPADDGDDSNDPRACSSAALLERFATEFRSLAAKPGFALERVAPAEADPPLAPGRRRYRLSHTLAVELLLRKDYRADWESEVKEEYTYLTQAQFEAVFGRLGLRVLASTPIRNPWIVAHRFQGRFALFSLVGAPIDHPATNYVIVGERVADGLGVRFEAGPEQARLGFLEPSCYVDQRTGLVRDLVRRPGASIDVIPWFRSGADVHVLARMSYPRPILASVPTGSVPVDGSRAPHYVTEPLTLIQGDKPIAQTAEDYLCNELGLAPDQLLGFRRGGTYYPSPGGIQEEVRSLLIEVAPVQVLEAAAGRSGFSSSGRVGAIEARQLLRAAQVSGLPDARLELGVYDLLARLGLAPGPWIAEAIELENARFAPVVSAASVLSERPSRRTFRAVPVDRSPGFLELRCAPFRELDRNGSVVAERALEAVAPRVLSINTVAALVLAKVNGEVLVGVDDDDLPAAQCFNGGSELLVAPAWRLPREITSTTPARAWVRRKLHEEYGLRAGRCFELGGRYHPSPGVTAEVVHPLVIEAASQEAGTRSLVWVRLSELIALRRELLLDGHLRTLACRAAHALSLWPAV